MAIVSLGFTALFGIVGVGVRAAVHARRTGRSPLRHGAGVGGWAALVGNGIAFVAGPVLDLVMGKGRMLRGPAPPVIGVALAVAGLATTVWAQMAMGDAWRIGVDPAERTRLVTAGPFQWSRNPIYAAMITFAFGLALLVPNVASFLGALFVVVGLEVHVRHVEEPHLTGAYAGDYSAYAARVGRFVPGVGKLGD
jgi:protein-S-isoprenylcysteine O-methyltransferase Ste14